MEEMKKDDEEEEEKKNKLKSLNNKVDKKLYLF